MAFFKNWLGSREKKNKLAIMGGSASYAYWGFINLKEFAHFLSGYIKILSISGRKKFFLRPYKLFKSK